MSQNFLTRLYYGMVYRWTHIGTMTKIGKTEPNWAGSQQDPEEELEQLLSSIKERVYTLRDTVHEQSKEIESDLEAVEQIVSSDEDDKDKM